MENEIIDELIRHLKESAPNLNYLMFSVPVDTRQITLCAEKVSVPTMAVVFNGSGNPQKKGNARVFVRKLKFSVHVFTKSRNESESIFSLLNQLRISLYTFSFLNKRFQFAGEILQSEPSNTGFCSAVIEVVLKNVLLNS